MSSIYGRCTVAVLLVASLLAGRADARAQEPEPDREKPSEHDSLESRFFDSGDVRLHYIDEGSGDPVLLIHGFSLDLGLNWVQPGIVDALTRAGYRVVAYDTRGHGGSQKFHEAAMYGPPDVEDPVRLLDHLGIARAHVVGYSRGARIAHHLRAEHPHRLRSVVLGGYGEGSGEADPFGAAMRSELADSMARDDYRSLVRAVAPDVSAEEVEGWQGLLRERNDGRALAAAFRSDLSFRPFTERELLANEVPTLAMIGEEDPFRERVERMRRVMGRLEVLVLPGADHGTTLERPEFVTGLLGFLGKQRGAAIEFVRTPDARFDDLPGYPFEPRYATIEGLRVHYVDEGPRDGPVVVLLHGEPSWSFLYREIIPPLADAGFRVVAPDLVGFGKSDKPVRREDYSYAAHVEWMRALLFDHLELDAIHLFVQDWGGLIGLRLVGEHPDRFARVAAANTALPTGAGSPSPAFLGWLEFSQNVPEFPVGQVLQMGTVRELPPEVIRAYDAPFPDERYKAGARVFPALVPITPDDPAVPANRAAWEVLEKWERPFLTLFSDQDPITAGLDELFRSRIPGARGQPHGTIRDAGHFLQEDSPAELTAALLDFLRLDSSP